MTGSSSHPDGSQPSLVIDCDDCSHLGTATCEDCVVSFFVGVPDAAAVVIDATEALAVRRLGQAGLLPPLRHDPRAQALGG